MTRIHLVPTRLRTGAALLLVLLIAGCGDSGMLRGEAELEAERAEAQALAEQGLHLEAARRYEQLAGRGSAAWRFQLATEAAHAFVQAGDWDEALRVLPPAESAPAGEDWLDWAPLAGRVLLAAGREDEALAALDRLPAELPAGLARDVLLLRAEAHFALGNVFAGVEAMQARERRLTSQAEILDHHRLLWRHLQSAGDAVLEAAEQPALDREVAGWLALGAIGVNASRNPAGLAAEMLRWRGAYPSHPAGDALVDEVLAGYRGLMSFPRQLALLLPLTGAQQAAGLAVRDGFLAAYFETGDGGDRPHIRVYDTATASAQELYRQAVNDGADFIVGPLLRESVDGIAAVAGTVPTLALNRLSGGSSSPSLFFQFALSPEEEAQQAARVAMERHGGRAIALVSNDEWGQRLLSSFAQALEEAGGQLLEHGTFNTWDQDFSAQINRLLELDYSQQRHQRLAGNLGATLQFEPRRRQDADFLFLGARTPQARLIRPQLRYFFAADVPVYATSAVFEPAGGADNDLNGIFFADAPWLLAPDAVTARLRDQVETHWPQRGRQLGRLYAMGFDAYQLVPLLFGANGTDPIPSLDGMSGELHVDASGLVLRRLTWAQFRNGVPALIPPPAAFTRAQRAVQPGVAAAD